ncbi:hypothetical protein HD597_000742 [Nonomuraea thailandensis]|uniref:Transposase IS110-like N-terminal domain-containing protein n=1 Tax=Nonomuraea thailandensis TaxID=1188745 RepID=A0A9X2JY23_9ACTN|nr:IS110 family transposase [Nonomuraea thailandensis]MCP2353722.1 hypothetical protein [Nonomuraea thailandensis]
MFVGWDWGNVGHDVTVLAPDGAKIDQWALEHTEHSLTSALARLRRHGSPEELPVAIETTRGLVVDRLLAAGHPVMPIHPNAFNAIRPRWGAARAKTDAGDSFKLADYLRTAVLCSRPAGGAARIRSRTWRNRPGAGGHPFTGGRPMGGNLVDQMSLIQPSMPE